MKTLIISDIHGSAQALENVLSTPHHYDSIIIVGDHMYHGPRNPILEDYNPAKVADLLNAKQCPKIAVRGNCDSEVDQMLLDHDMLQDYTITSIEGLSIYITHGHLHQPLDHITNTDLYISGHTHLPYIIEKGNTTYLNPGSIALPKGGNPASYAYLDGKDLTIYSIDHEIMEKKSLR